MPSRSGHGLLIAAVIVGIMTAAVVWRAIEPQLFALSPAATGDTPVALTVGGELITPEANMLRFADQRRPGNYPRVELLLTWPALLAPTPDDPALRTTARDGMLLFVTIEPRETDLDTADRIGTIYQKFLSQDQGPDPDARLENGLVRRKFLTGTAYDGEELYFEPGSVHPFAARCFPLANGEHPGSCLRDVRLAKHLVATLRFPIRALQDWRRLRDRLDVILGDLTGGVSG